MGLGLGLGLGVAKAGGPRVDLRGLGLTATLRGYLRCEETGGDFYDEVSRAYWPVESDDATRPAQVAGFVGHGRRFLASKNHRINLPGPNSLGSALGWTVNLWARAKSIGINHTLACRGAGTLTSNYEYTLYLLGSNVVRGSISDGTSTNEAYHGTLWAAEDAHMVTMRYDHITKTLGVMLDAVWQEEATAFLAAGMQILPDAEQRIGKNANNNPADCDIDEYSVHGKYLSNEEILFLFGAA